MLKKAHGKFITLLCAKKKIAVRQNKAHGKAKHGYAVCPIFIVFFLDDTWQKSCLLCARDIAHGKLCAHGKYAIFRCDE